MFSFFNYLEFGVLNESLKCHFCYWIRRKKILFDFQLLRVLSVNKNIINEVKRLAEIRQKRKENFLTAGGTFKKSWKNKKLDFDFSKQITNTFVSSYLFGCLFEYSNILMVLSAFIKIIYNNVNLLNPIFVITSSTRCYVT
jgi:hypothetical protein